MTHRFFGKTLAHDCNQFKISWRCGPHLEVVRRRPLVIVPQCLQRAITKDGIVVWTILDGYSRQFRPDVTELRAYLLNGEHGIDAPRVDSAMQLLRQFLHLGIEQGAGQIPRVFRCEDERRIRTHWAFCNGEDILDVSVRLVYNPKLAAARLRLPGFLDLWKNNVCSMTMALQGRYDVRRNVQCTSECGEDRRHEENNLR